MSRAKDAAASPDRCAKKALNGAEKRVRMGAGLNRGRKKQKKGARRRPYGLRKELRVITAVAAGECRTKPFFVQGSKAQSPLDTRR